MGREPWNLCSERAVLDPRPKGAVMDVEARQCVESSQVDELTHSLSWIAGSGVDTRNEVVDPADRVPREEGVSQSAKIEPPERRILESTVVEVEAVDVEPGTQFRLRRKDRDRPEGRSRPITSNRHGRFLNHTKGSARHQPDFAKNLKILRPVRRFAGELDLHGEADQRSSSAMRRSRELRGGCGGRSCTATSSSPSTASAVSALEVVEPE